jgi:hypothetical protein
MWLGVEVDVSRESRAVLRYPGIGEVIVGYFHVLHRTLRMVCSWFSESQPSSKRKCFADSFGFGT